jgi:hypothetical protein
LGQEEATTAVIVRQPDAKYLMNARMEGSGRFGPFIMAQSGSGAQSEAPWKTDDVSATATVTLSETRSQLNLTLVATFKEDTSCPLTYLGVLQRAGADGGL